MKKDEHLENQKSNIFYFLNVHPFSPGGFFAFLVVVAHGGPRRNVTKYRVTVTVCRNFFLLFLEFEPLPKL